MNFTTQGKINEEFMLSLDNKTCTAIIKSIAKHYGATIDDAMDEFCGDDAEHILDYITVNRPTVSLYYRMWASKNSVRLKAA